MRRIALLAASFLLLAVPVARAWTWPAGGEVLSPFVFDRAHPYAGGQHRGIDIAAAPGETILAPAAGSVSFAGTVPGGGPTLTILTPGGYAVTLLHLGSLAVARGAAVAEGQSVGAAGSGGSVYLGVRLASDPQGYVDPLGFLPPRAIPAAPSPDPAPAPRARAGTGGRRPFPAPEPAPAVAPAPEPVVDAPPAAVAEPPVPDSPPEAPAPPTDAPAVDPTVPDPYTGPCADRREPAGAGRIRRSGSGAVRLPPPRRSRLRLRSPDPRRRSLTRCSRCRPIRSSSRHPSRRLSPPTRSCLPRRPRRPTRLPPGPRRETSSLPSRPPR